MKRFGDGTLSMRGTILVRLQTDVTLSSILSGGVFALTDIEVQDGGGLEWAPKDENGVRIAPHAKLHWHEAIPQQPAIVKLAAEQQTLRVYVYQDLGYTELHDALDRVKELLHNAYVQCSDQNLVHIRYAGRSAEMRFESMGEAPTLFMDFTVIYENQS